MLILLVKKIKNTVSQTFQTEELNRKEIKETFSEKLKKQMKKNFSLKFKKLKSKSKKIHIK